MFFEFCVFVICFYNVSPYPAGIKTLDFDKLDADISDLKYEAADSQLADFSKILDYDYDDETEKKKKKQTGLNHKHNIGDIKKFYKTIGFADNGSHEDEEKFAIAEQVTEKAVVLSGKENRKYRKGTKTRGFHNIHHKDEYKKEKEFVDDDITSGEINKVGAKVLSIQSDVGSGFSKGRHHRDRKKGIFGKSGYSDKGHFDSEFNVYSDS